MPKISPRVAIEGAEVEYIEGSYTLNGGGKAAELAFTLPNSYAAGKKLWNKEVTLYLNSGDSTPIFRGWIRRANPNLDEIEILAMDALGYLIKGGGQSKAVINLTPTDNLDGYTAGGAITTAIKKAKLNTKLGTDMIGDTKPAVSASRPPLRGQYQLEEIIKSLMSAAIDNSGTIPRPNLYKIVDDGSQSQLVIELQADVDTAQIAHIFTEENNIIGISINEKKIPTIINVSGEGGVNGTFSHDGAITALDRTYLQVDNPELKSPAECVDFGRKLFQANLKDQYEYGIEVTEGAYLMENDVVRVETTDKSYTGNYRVIGKTISFSPNDFEIGIVINKKPPTLAEYISARDN